MKRKYEEELAELREDYRKEKSEKEHLRVRNKLLQDMSQIIVDRCLKPEITGKKRETVVLEADDENDPEMISDLLKNKHKGYRRVSPAERADKEKENEKNRSKHNASSTNDRIKKPHQENQEHDQHEVPRESIQYCSFFNNGGKCTIAERLGRECRFIHKLAPMCNFDTQCVRPRCMFRHTHSQGGN